MAEDKRKGFSGHPPEGYFVTSSVKSDLQNQFNSIFLDFSKREDAESIDNILDNCLEGEYLVASCNVGQENEQWITFATIQASNDVKVFLVQQRDLKFGIKDVFKSKFASKNVTVLVYDIEGNSRLNVALANMDTLMTELLENDYETFAVRFNSKEIEFGKRNNVLEFSKKIFETLVSKKFRAKGSLEKTIKLLQYILDFDGDYILPCDADKLSAILVSHTFVPREGDTVDLQKLVYQIFIVLKERGQILNKTSHDHFHKFFELNKEDFLDKINYFVEELKINLNDNVAQTLLVNAINDRIELLICCGKLAPEILSLKDGDDILKLFGDSNLLKSLEEEKEQLEEELDEIERKVHALAKSEDEPGMSQENNMEDNTATGNFIESEKLPDEDTSVFLNKIKLATRMVTIQKTINQLSNNIRMRKNVTFDEFLLILEQIKKSGVDLCQETLDCILERGKLSDNIDVVLAVVNIINCLPSERKLKYFPCEIFKKIPMQKAELIIDHGLSNRLQVDNLPDLFDFLHVSLIEHEDESRRNKAYDVLYNNQEHLTEAIYLTLQLETKCKLNESSFAIDCLGHVKSKRKLTLNCFAKLAGLSYEDNHLIEVAIEVLQNGVQRLPNNLVEKLKGYLTKLDKFEMNKFKVVRLLLRDRYLKFIEMKDLIGKVNEESMLTMLHQSMVNGDEISNDSVEDLKLMNSYSEYAANILQLLNKSFSSFDVVRNSRKPLQDRQNALQNIANGTNNQENISIKDINILMSLLKYEPYLRSDALKALIALVPNNFVTESNVKIDLTSIGSCLFHSDINIEDIKALAVKDDSADVSILVDVILYRIAMAGDQEQEVTASFLVDIINPNRKHLVANKAKNIFKVASSLDNILVRQSLLTLISHNMTVDEIAEKIGTEEFHKHDTVQLLALDNTDDLSSFVNILKSGFIVTKEMTKTIAKTLANTDIKEHYDLLAAMLNIISENQTIDADDIAAIFIAIEKNVDLLESTDAIFLITKYNAEISDTMINKLWKLFLQSSFDEDEVILALVHLLFSEYKRGVEFLDELGAKEDRLSQSLFKQLKFKNLEDSIEETNLNDDNLLKYFEEFKDLLDDEYMKDKLENYVVKMPQSIDKKYKLLMFLKNIILYEQELDVSMFYNCKESDWLREILCSVLVTEALLSSKLDNENETECELKTFTANIELLNDTNSESLNPMEDALNDLIGLQKQYNLDIKEINDMLTMLWYDEAGWAIIKKRSNDVLIELKKLFLTNKLNENELDFKEENFIKLEELTLYYRTETLSDVLGNVKKGSSIEQVIGFFKALSDSALTLQHRERFLSGLNSKSDGSPSDWVHNINSFLVDELLSQNKMYSSINGNQELLDIFSNLVGLEWKLSSIKTISDAICKITHEPEIVAALNIVVEYKLKEYDSNIKGIHLIEIFLNKKILYDQWESEVHELAIFQTFRGSRQKDITQLRIEIMHDLNEKEDLRLLLAKPCENDFNLVMSTYECPSSSSILRELGSISGWKESSILKWSDVVRKNSNLVTLHEKVAVLRRAVYFHSGKKYHPRDVQLLSGLILLNPRSKQGRLTQINTGEGKTMIVSMLAVIKALEGHQVDIITSSPELARPQAKEQRPFFQMFGLTVAHNGTDQITIERRYQADIVYGAAGDFQGDILRDEFSKLGTRSGRKCDVAIVDEVDSMLIDGKNHMVMLSSPMPSMDHLEPVLAAIWIQMGIVADCIVEQNGVAYVSDYQDRLGADGTIDPKVEEELVPIEGTKAEFVKNCVVNHIRKALRDEERLTPEENDELKKMGDKYPKLHIPNHLRQLVTEAQLEKWVDSAIYAKYKCEEGKHYILSDDKIAPVDAVNTGIVQRNMHWSNGLHQFLQIKHGAKISVESFTTNFLSNVSFFRRYGSDIYGLTGTLGSRYATELLNDTYNVDSVIIPPFKHKQYLELSSVVTYNEIDWHNEIVKSALSKLNQGRAVLIITKYIAEAQHLMNLFLERKYENSKMKIYRTAEDSDVIKKPLNSGEMIIATNIAGRGTDIKPTKQVESNGGLHVCVTFLPPNERVEQQNVGRTSRTGNRGTGQFVLLANRGSDLVTLKQKRDHKEEKSLQSARLEISKIVIKDKLFQRFCKMLSTLFDHEKKLSKVEKKTNKIMKRSLEDKFGIWLKVHEETFDKKDDGECLNLFDQFENQVFEDNANGKQISNPFFRVLRGNEFIKENKFQDAITEFNDAIRMDAHFAANAYYGRGYARLALHGKNKNNHKTHINDAVNDFRKAKEIIEDHLEPMLHVIQKASDSEALSEQVKHKITLHDMQKNTIDSAIGIGCGETDKQIKELEDSRTDKSSEEIEKINEQIKSLKDCDKDSRDKGVIGQAKDKGRGVNVEFLDLKEVFPQEEDINLYQEEIIEYENNGFLGHFKVTEIVPICWWSVIGLFLLGLVQMIAGGALMLFSCGTLASIGSGLIAEGASDMVTAIKDGIINKTFDWAKWGMEKAISLTVGLLCAGFSALKSMVTTAIKGVTSVVKAAGHTIKSVCFQMGKELAKAGAKAMVEQLVDLGLDRAIMPYVRDKLMDSIEPQIQAALKENQYVNELLEQDGKNRNRKFQDLLTKRITKLLQDEVKKERSMFGEFVNGVKEGLKDETEKGLFGKIKKGLSIVEETGKLVGFMNKFRRDLDLEINQIAKEQGLVGKTSTSTQPGVEAANENSRDEISSDGEPQGIPEQSGEMADSVEEVKQLSNEDVDESDIDLKEKDVNQIKLGAVRKTADELGENLTQQVVTKMCSLIEGKFIKPALLTGANYGTKILGQCASTSISKYQAKRKLKLNPDHSYNRQDALLPQDPLKEKVTKKAKEWLKKELVKSIDGVIFDACPVGGAVLGAIGGFALVYNERLERNKKRAEAAKILQLEPLDDKPSIPSMMKRQDVKFSMRSESNVDVLLGRSQSLPSRQNAFEELRKINTY